MRRSTAPVGLFLTIALLVAAVASVRLTRGAGSPVYPDLRTLPPSHLSLRKELLDDEREHYLLRFDNTIGNWGGPLEIVADLEESRDLFQNVYDAYSGGALVSSTKIDTDLIFHPTHNHFHFQDFASYVLLQKNSSGSYVPTSRKGAKTSFCILDSIRVAQLGSGAASFTSCSAQRQGLSAGFGDVYTAGLPEQWIDLGLTLPGDGDFAVQSMADPTNKLRESRDDNNSAVTYFSIRGGKLTATVATEPVCVLTPATGPVGTQVRLSCEHLNARETFDLRWNGPSEKIIKSVTANGDGEFATSLVVPYSTLGPHYIHVTGQTSGQSALALFSTTPAIRLDQTSGRVGSSVEVLVTGFASREVVTLRYTTTGTTKVTLASPTTNLNGSRLLGVTIPASTLGPHKIEAKGATSGKTATVSINIVPSMTLSPNTAAAGSRVAPALTGFNASERITISIPSRNLVLKTTRVSSAGSLNANNTNSFTVPKSLPPGTYVVRALGASSGATATAKLKVTAATTASAAVAAGTDEPDQSVQSEPTATSDIEKSATATTEEPSSERPGADDRSRRRPPTRDDQ